MFYEENMERNLRFGDVLKGFITSFVDITKPVMNPTDPHQYRIEVAMPEFTVVVSPCCSIGPNVISLTPLLMIQPSFLKNEYFAGDLTRINRMMKPKEQFPSHEWERMSAEEKTRRIDEGLGFALFDYFIYDKNELLPEYEKKSTTIQHYMIDFRKIFHINCQKIKSNGRVEEGLVASKWLQLSVDARSDLRAKISNYYGRIPDEDKALMD